MAVHDSNGSLMVRMVDANGDDVPGGGIVKTVVAGTNVSVDATDPENPIVSATGGGGEVTAAVPAGSSYDITNETVVVFVVGEVYAGPFTLNLPTKTNGAHVRIVGPIGDLILFDTDLASAFGEITISGGDSCDPGFCVLVSDGVSWYFAGSTYTANI